MHVNHGKSEWKYHLSSLFFFYCIFVSFSNNTIHYFLPILSRHLEKSLIFLQHHSTIRFVIFNRWHEALVGAKAAQERFIRFVTKLSGKEHYACFGAWQRMSIIHRTTQKKDNTLDIEHQITVAKAALKQTREKIADRKMHLVMMEKLEKDLVASCQWTQSELDARYNNPLMLNAVTKTLSTCCVPLLPLGATSVVKARSSQVERRDRSHVPIHDMYDYGAMDDEHDNFVEAERKASAKEDEDDDVDVAFPFELKSGHVVLRWLNYSVRKQSGRYGDNDDGDIPLDGVPGGYLCEYNQLRMKHLYAVAMRTMPQEMTRAIRNERDLTTTGMTKKTIEQRQDQQDPFALAATILAAGKLRRREDGTAFGGFLSVEQLVPDHEQEEEEERQLSLSISSISVASPSPSPSPSPRKNNSSPSSSPKTKRRKKSSQKRETENVQRVLYKGKMIDVEDPSEQLIFALLCQLMDARPTVDEVEIDGTSGGNSGEGEHNERMIEDQQRSDNWLALNDEERQQHQHSASKIQATFRGKRARNHTLTEHKERILAATKIQAIHRGRNQRREKPRLELSETLVASQVDASMAYDEINATWLGLTNVLRDVASSGMLELTHEELRGIAEKVQKSRVAKLSSVVFDKWTATEDSFLAWRDAMFAAEKLAWRSVCQLTMAQKALIEERNDDGSFTRISHRRVKDLFPLISSIKSKGDSVKEVQEVGELLKEHLGLTMKIFGHYAGDVGSGSSMNRSEYTRFVKDAKIRSNSSKVNKNELNGATIDIIFAKVNAPMIDLSAAIKLKGKAKHAREKLKGSLTSSSPKISPKDSPQNTPTITDLDLEESQQDMSTDDKGNVDTVEKKEEEEVEEEEDFEGDENDKEIVPQEFIEALLRLAVARYKRGTLAQRLAMLFERNVAPLSSNVNDNTTLRAAMSEELVQNVLKRKRKRLTDLFLCYAARDDSDDAVAHSETINIGECTQMCRELSMNVPDRIIARLFACVQGDADDGNDDTSMQEEQGELTYTEFVELLGALAAWKRPDPYNPLSKKLNEFLDVVLKVHENINNVGQSKKRGRKSSTSK